MNRRTKIRWLSYAVALLVVLFTAVTACHVGADGYTTRIDAQSARAFGEALSAMERLDRSLQKSALAVGAPMESAVCTEIYSDAQSAETALSALPVELDALEEISRHIAVMGDYAFSLSRAAAQGETFSEETMQRLSSFSETTHTLCEQLEQLREAFQSGAVSAEHYGRLTDALDNLEEETEEAADTLNSELHTLAADFPASAPMVYDGVYCDHSGEEPKLLQGKAEVSQDEARQRAADFLGCSAEQLTPEEQTAGEIPCWRFSITEGQPGSSIAVTVQGGEILRYLSDTTANGEADHDAAQETAKAFLAAHGYPEMACVESASSGGMETLTFVPVQNGVLCLPDRVTMKVCPATKKVTSYDAAGYLKYHSDRDLAAFESAGDLRAALPEPVTVTQEGNVVLLSPGGQERFCRAFSCQMPDGSTATIYVNAETGQQERILLEGERAQTIN